MDKISRAFVVTAPDYEEGAVVVFATHGLQARRLGASKMGFYYDETQYYAKREPKFDKWADLGFVPEKEFINEGWYIYSEFWQYRLNEPVTREQYEEIEEDHAGYMDGLYVPEDLIESPNRRHIYFNMKEVEEEAYYLEGFRQAGAKFKQYVIDNFPHYHILKWNIDYPMITKTAEFIFPGSKFGGTIRWADHDNPIEEVEVYVAYGDQAAFDLWQEAGCPSMEKIQNIIKDNPSLSVEFVVEALASISEVNKGEITKCQR